MNGTPSDDRISAYFDDELPLDQRAQVQEELATSESAQAELNDLHKISSLLKELPVKRAPEELYSSVMRAIERDSLMPAKETTTKATPTRAVRWKTIISGTIAAAAAIVAVAMLSPRNQQVAQNEKAPTTVSGSVKNGKQLANQNQSVQEQQGAKDGKEFRLNSDDLASAKPGDEVKATSSDGVSVIRLTVVDLQRGASALRVLLAGQHIKTVGSNSEEAGDGVIAVYVQSDPTKIATAIEKLKQEADYQSITSPGSFESSDPALQQMLPTELAATEADSSQTVPVKPGSKLDKLAKSQIDDSKAPVAKGRVIFLIVNDHKPGDAPKGKPNGAA